MMSETAKHRALLEGYCRGNGLDLGSAGDPIVPTAIQVDLPDAYCAPFDTRYPVQIRGDATNLIWFRDAVFDYCFSSHLIEDFDHEQQKTIVREWARVVKPGGNIVILAPEFGRWQKALQNGQPPNLSHKHEPRIGELSAILAEIDGWDVLEERFCTANDYGMFFVARKLGHQ